tara:strand:- start:129 stop:500 length:372 start_codon:yes stop_codon:yes gene_type:complete
MDKGKKNIERVIKSDRIQEKKKKFVVGLRNNLGNISKACDAVGISRTTYYDWIESDDLFKEDVEHIKESLLDLAECKLLENIEDNQNIAIIFYLKTKGKKRGYIEKQEVEVVRPISEVLFDEL